MPSVASARSCFYTISPYSLAMQGGKVRAAAYPDASRRMCGRDFSRRSSSCPFRAPVALQAVVAFVYLTGWRVPSEVLQLEWRQVDLDAGTVRLDAHTTKNDSGRVLPYGEVLPDLSDLL